MSDDSSAASPTAFRSDMAVTLVRAAAQDADVVWAARVSTQGDESIASVGQDAEGSKGLINYLLKNRHGTPFEHNSMTFLISAPIFVFREFMRHRIGWSYNEESGRYRQLEPVFYVPGPDRRLRQEGKAGHYIFVDAGPEVTQIAVMETKRACGVAYESYLTMLKAGVAREVARGVLPVATYSSMYATCNARSLMSFLSLRTKADDSVFPSYPQREIEMVADQMEQHFADLMPITHAAFVGAGRVSP